MSNVGSSLFYPDQYVTPTPEMLEHDRWSYQERRVAELRRSLDKQWEKWNRDKEKWESQERGKVVHAHTPIARALLYPLRGHSEPITAKNLKARRTILQQREVTLERYQKMLERDQHNQALYTDHNYEAWGDGERRV